MRLGPKMKKTISLMQDGKVYTRSELEEKGVEGRVLKRLVEGSVLRQPSRGLYFLSDGYLDDPSQAHDNGLLLDEFLEASIAGGPDTVMCFYAAANYYHVGDDSGAVLHAAIPHARGGLPQFMGCFQHVRFRNRQDFDFEFGVDKIEYRGRTLKITSKVRTAIDMLRFSPFNANMSKPQVMIDEESAAKAVAACFDDPEIIPAEIGKMAHYFGVDRHIKAAMEVANHRTKDDEEVRAPKFG